MLKFLQQPAHKPAEIGPEADAKYKKLRLQVFLGAFIGYAGFYLVRNNLSLAGPGMKELGYDTDVLGLLMMLNAAAYALSKFLMGSVSDRSNARVFLPLGLILTAISMCFIIVPFQVFGTEHKTEAIVLVGILNFLVGWFNGMGWPPCGRVMTHWFSVSERGTMMSIWNCAHNVGGALVGPMATYGATWFGSWFYGTNEKMYFLIGTFAFPAAVAVFIALLAYILLRDTPQSCGLPPVEKWRNDYPKNYSEKHEKAISAREIFFEHVLNNKFLWYIALANAFVYMVRYGCLNWAPTILTQKGFDIKSAGWAYFAYEIAAIPGTILCGWLSDKVFHSQRALPTILFMAIVAVFVGLYWAFIDNFTMVVISLIGIGFFIYGPVMLIGVQAIDLVPKNAAGTAAGLTGFFGYFFGTALLGNALLGLLAKGKEDWTIPFLLLLIACILAIVFMGLTYKEEQYLVKKEKKD